MRDRPKFDENEFHQQMEALREKIRRDAIEQADIHRLPKVFCIKGHIQKPGQHNLSTRCYKCAAELVSNCQCGSIFDLRYDYNPKNQRLSSGRDYCVQCGVITPWSKAHLMRASSSQELSFYEKQLISRLQACPSLEDYDLEQKTIGTHWTKWYDRLLGHGISIQDRRHPNHSRWSNYQEEILALKQKVILLRNQAEERRLKGLSIVNTWRGLSGSQFEKELAALLRRKGFLVTHVGGRGDNGADLLLELPTRRVVIQCKAHSKKIGPGAVRDLFGCLQHHFASEGWLVSIEGFSDASYSFAHMKPLKLITIEQILQDHFRFDT